MGRGCGGYAEKKPSYKDSGGHKVTDQNAIFVAEQYIDQGYEVVFRQRHDPDKSYDLSIKSSDDQEFIKNIEVKGVTSNNPSKISTRIEEGFAQFKSGSEDTVAIYLPKFKNDHAGQSFAIAGYQEAVRKGVMKGHVEVWFSDGTKVTLC